MLGGAAPATDGWPGPCLRAPHSKMPFCRSNASFYAEGESDWTVHQAVEAQGTSAKMHVKIALRPPFVYNLIALCDE